MKYTFSKQHRLLRPSQYNLVFNQAQLKIHQEHLLAFVRGNGLAQGRLGMAITKRKIPTAVARNQLKRLLREQFRQDSIKYSGVDVVFIAKKPIESKDYKKVKNQINAIFKKIESKKNAMV